MSNIKCFVELYLNGEALLEDLDDYIEEWHESNSKLEIYEYLGFTKQEYYLWVEESKILMDIFEARVKRIPILEHLNNIYNSPVAARAVSVEEANKIREWLKATGRM